MTRRDRNAENRGRVERVAQDNAGVRNPTSWPESYRAKPRRREHESPDAKVTHRRFEPVSAPYHGLEGMLRAQAEGKIWLNDINLVMPMMFEWMILELRKLAHELANDWDKVPLAWPSVLGDVPGTYPPQRNMVRWARFCEIFSGRDDRFAIINWNAPGGGLEQSLVEFMGHDQDDESWNDGVTYQWPLNLDNPLDSPRLMRLLFLFLDETSHGCLLPLAEALMDFREEHDESIWESPYVVDTFRDVLCRNTEILLGLPDNMLRDVTEPPCDYVNLLIRVRMREIPEEGESSISLIGLQPRPSPANNAAAPLFVLTSKKHGIAATARQADGDFIVLKGSQAFKSWTSKSDHSYSKRHAQLIEQGALTPDGSGKLVFSEDAVFTSPSAASSVILGRPDNGRTSWKLSGSNISYGQWQSNHPVVTAT